ncbi:MAG: DNA translocase FtsK [Candidatus Omnitrophica bacterium]|nr:DNA translocase FtsK [Candidatus Omnitrophota bacterium]
MAKGGLLGYWISSNITGYFGRTGSYIILWTLLILSLLLVTEFLLLPLLVSVINIPKQVFDKIKTLRFNIKPGAGKARVNGVNKDKVEKLEVKEAVEPEVKTDKSALGGKDRFTVFQRKVEKKPDTVPKPLGVKPKRVVGDYKLPPLDLLNSPPPVAERQVEDDINNNSRILEETLKDFGIEVKVTQADRGPVITRYELQPAAGVKVQKIVALSDDIALAMKAHSVRIVAPIPGKSRVGVEVPNSTTTTVYLKEILESKEFQASDSKLTLVLGKDTSGMPIVTDLSDMPHLLIAGTTGSGKTVCVNGIITSILFNATPDEVKFIMVDPKMVEMACFNGLPHLLCPVVTDAKKASHALRWTLNEMEDRYKLFARLGVRNIDIYNEKVEKDKGKKASDAEGEKEDALFPMPYIIIIIDELADLMMVSSQDVENAITRLAQLSRAVGIHIILATQRPSVDVITGVIKANFPARISFQVASKVDSRTVLDVNGADKLLGKGDMLFLRPGTSKPIRAQGSLLTDEEIERVIQFIKSQKEPVYIEEIINAGTKGLAGIVAGEEDELYEEAKNIIVETGQASISMLQRRLRIGYGRAARLIDTMESKGVIGHYRGSKSREVLVKAGAREV